MNDDTDCCPECGSHDIVIEERHNQPDLNEWIEVNKCFDCGWEEPNGKAGRG